MFLDTPIGLLAKKASSLSDAKIWMLSANNRLMKDLIIKLNTDEQLYKENVNSKGVKLNTIGGNYSPVTLLISKQKGRPKKNLQSINLFDTGEFYDSFKVTVNAQGILIEADTDKGDNDLKDRWGEDIIGLTDENMGVIIGQIKETYIRILRQELGI